jgi:transcriptional regulator with XRE-family HTH domain
MDKQKTAAYIRRLRTENHMTQKQLAEKIFVTDKAVSKWERGNGSPDVSLLPLLADALGVTADDILNGGCGVSRPASEPPAVVGISDSDARVKRFTEKRHVRVFIILPIIWLCLFGVIGILYVYAILASYVPVYPEVFFGLFVPWFIISSVTGFIPLAASYAWHRLSQVK